MAEGFLGQAWAPWVRHGLLGSDMGFLDQAWSPWVRPGLPGSGIGSLGQAWDSEAADS